MALLKISILLLTLVSLEECESKPGHHHIHHRIHIPTKVKTIYHTKIIKVPEHHHYIHEKEKPKLIKVPEHHHYIHEKEKEKLVDLHDIHHGEISHDFHQDFDEGHHTNFNFDEEASHNIFKKHAPPHLYKKRKTH